MLNTLHQIQADIQSLHEAIDSDASLQTIRIAALRALTRNRFFTEEVLKATGDWEPRLQNEERNRRHEVVTHEYDNHLQKLAQTKDGIHAVGKFLREKVPLLPEEVGDRASLSLGQLFKHIIHRISYVCLRNREDEAAQHWERETHGFEREQQQRDAQREFLEKLTPERLEKLHDALEKLEKMRDLSEPGDDWVTMDEVVGSDEVFEENRRRILREDGQELQLYAMILERRLKMGNAYSGLDLIQNQESIPMPHEKPDWEPDEERETLIAALEEITGKTFRP